MHSSHSANPTSPKTLIAVAVTFLTIASAYGLVQEAKAQQDQDSITVELHKLEPSDKGCGVYIVISNTSSTAYDAFKLELAIFKTDGIIDRILTLNLAPILPSKRSAKAFELEGAKCEDIGSFLVNGVGECRTADQAEQDCLARLKVSSLTTVGISK